MKNKQIIFTKPYIAELVDIELPEICGDEILVKTAYSAISPGTERANFIGESNVSGIKNNAVGFPRALGYSSSGTVERVGENVCKVKKGDRVVVHFKHHKKYNIAKENDVFLIPDAVALDQAAIVVIATFSLNGLRKTRLEVGESALVIGLGLLGQLAVQLCRAAGAVPIIVSDTNEKRREIAVSLGANYALSPSNTDFSEKIKEITGGLGVDAIIEVSGHASAISQALESAARFGRISLLGCTRNYVDNVDFYRNVHFPGVSLIGAHTFARPQYESMPGSWTAEDDAKTIMDLIVHNRLDFKSLIEEYHSPADAFKVYNRLAENKDFPLGVLFDWSKV